jgi:hypothetical protein
MSTFHKFPTWHAAMAWILARHPKPPAWWVGVCQVRPNADDGDIEAKEYRITGTDADGVEVQECTFARRVLSSASCRTAAEAAVNHEAGHKDTGWYTENVYESGIEISRNGHTVCVYPHPDDCVRWKS